MKRKISFAIFSVIVSLFVFTAAGASAAAQTTAFTYQGKLTDGANSAPTGAYDLQFTLWDAASGGTQQPQPAPVTVTRSDVNVTNGVFAVSLDFTAAGFDGAARYLQISVKKPSDANYTDLIPRQPITSAPYAIRALNASSVETTGGNSVVNSINNAATSTTINSSRLSSDVVRLKPATPQTATSNDSSAALLDASGTTTDANNNVLGTSRFRFNFNGGFFASGQQNFGVIPIEGAGTRMMWYPGKSAFRAGSINGTQWDDANIGYFSTAFGENVRASGDYAFAVGRNTTAANGSSVAMGEFSIASGYASVALGYYAHTNARQGSFVFSDRSIPDDGDFRTDESFRAASNHSFNVRAVGGYYFYTNSALTSGLRMSSWDVLGGNYVGSFVWTDRSNNDVVAPSAPNQTIFRSSGGYTIYTSANLASGVRIAPGSGTWQSVSDRNAKENFRAVNPRDILRKVLGLPISTWNYKTQDASIRHIGAMAQDFKAAFAVGEDDKRISTIDPDGVAFAAIQGLNAEMIEMAAKLRRENRRLRSQLAAQNRRLAAQSTEMSEFAARLKRLEQSSTKMRRTIKTRR